MRNAIERRLVAYSGARMALKRLIFNGLSREQLLDELLTLHIAKLGDSTRSGRRKSTALLGTPEGMTWRQFARFLQQLQNLATAIEVVNDNLYYDPARWFSRSFAVTQSGGRDLVAEVKDLRGNAGRLEVDYFLQLPLRLRVYALYLEIVAKKVRKELRSKQLKTVPYWSKCRDRLATYVHTNCKGQHRMTDIAVLISAALGNEEEVDPETLRKQVYRKKHRPHPVKQLF